MLNLILVIFSFVEFDFYELNFIISYDFFQTSETQEIPLFYEAVFGHFSFIKIIFEFYKDAQVNCPSRKTKYTYT